MTQDIDKFKFIDELSKKYSWTPLIWGFFFGASFGIGMVKAFYVEQDRRYGVTILNTVEFQHYQEERKLIEGYKKGLEEKGIVITQRDETISNQIKKIDDLTEKNTLLKKEKESYEKKYSDENLMFNINNAIKKSTSELQSENTLQKKVLAACIKDRNEVQEKYSSCMINLRGEINYPELQKINLVINYGQSRAEDALKIIGKMDGKFNEIDVAVSNSRHRGDDHPKILYCKGVSIDKVYNVAKLLYGAGFKEYKDPLISQDRSCFSKEISIFLRDGLEVIYAN